MFSAKRPTFEKLNAPRRAAVSLQVLDLIPSAIAGGNEQQVKNIAPVDLKVGSQLDTTSRTAETSVTGCTVSSCVSVARGNGLQSSQMTWVIYEDGRVHLHQVCLKEKNL